MLGWLGGGRRSPSVAPIDCAHPAGSALRQRTGIGTTSRLTLQRRGASTGEQRFTMDAVFIVIVVALYAVTRWLVWAVSRLRDAK
jgi:hypothetical protein